MRYRPLRYYLEKVLRDMGGGISHWAVGKHCLDSTTRWKITCFRRKFLGCRTRSAGIGPFWGENFVAQSPAFSSELPGLHAQSASCCKGNYMAIQITKLASSVRQCWKEQDGACPVSSNHFSASYLLLSWIAQICVRQSLFRGPKF